jgi:hypothetical protein
MPSVHRLPTFEQRHSIEEIIRIRRAMLRYARSFPSGSERNQRRQIALSRRALSKNNDWLDAHTWEGAALLADRTNMHFRVPESLVNTAHFKKLMN